MAINTHSVVFVFVISNPFNTANTIAQESELDKGSISRLSKQGNDPVNTFGLLLNEPDEKGYEFLLF